MKLSQTGFENGGSFLKVLLRKDETASKLILRKDGAFSNWF